MNAWRKTSIRVDEDLWKEVRRQAVTREQTREELIDKALRAYLQIPPREHEGISIEVPRSLAGSVRKFIRAGLNAHRGGEFARVWRILEFTLKTLDMAGFRDDDERRIVNDK